MKNVCRRVNGSEEKWNTDFRGWAHSLCRDRAEEPRGAQFCPCWTWPCNIFFYFFPSYLILSSEEVKVENPKKRMQCCVLVCPVLKPLFSKPKQYFFNPGRKPFPPSISVDPLHMTFFINSCFVSSRGIALHQLNFCNCPYVFTLSTVNVGCLTPFSLQGKSFYLAFATDEEPKCGQWPRLSLVWDPNSAETQLHWTGWNVSGWSELFLIRLLSPEYHTAFFDKHKHFA